MGQRKRRECVSSRAVRRTGSSRCIRTGAAATVLAAIVTAVTFGSPQPALGNHPQPAFQNSSPQMDYTPIGYYGPPDEAGTPEGESATIPNPSGGPPAIGPNPSGKWVAYDTNVWESLALPSRHPGDNCNSLPAEDQHPSCREADKDADAELAGGDLTQATGYDGPGGVTPGGAAAHGKCTPYDEFPPPWGQCFNNQLEYLDYFETSMEGLLADFGVAVHRYPFVSPGRSDGGTERGGALDGAGGQAYNIAAVVPGADHPEQTVLVSGHYDFTDSGPAAAWDSAEGHTEVIRMAYIMANYWRQTGTRPSATVKFIPWDSEESGTFGSIDYVQNNIPPGEEDSVRGYFNVDPCAGAYPAYKDGTEERIPQVLQLADPEPWENADGTDTPTSLRIKRFNQRAARDTRPSSGTPLVTGPDIIDDVFGRLDDTITRPTPLGDEPIFVSDAEAAAGNDGQQPVTGSQRSEIVTALGGLAIFSSDYANFEDAGIPIFNFFPDLFGPHADGTPASAEGIAILHTPNDNLTRINRLTTGLTAPGNLVDPTGTFASEGWAKGQELCSQVEAHYMLQEEMAGHQTADPTAPTAYFEALPNEAVVDQNVKFDASGSHRITQLNPRQTSDAGLTYTWDFGDGTTGSGKNVQHAYDAVGRYTATLTVTGPGASSDTMTLPIEVTPSNFAPPVLSPLEPSNPDGSWKLAWDFEADRDGFSRFSVQESRDVSVIMSEDCADFTDNFAAEPPTNPVIDPWQPSDSSTQKNRGNLFRSSPRSCYTGLGRTDHEPGNGPNDGVSVLMQKSPLAVPARGSTALTYFSDFANDANDSGRVEAAIDTGGDLHWQTVDSLGLNAKDDYVISLTEEPTELSVPRFERRSIDLSRFSGKNIRLRWVYQLGDAQFLNVFRHGWYVDDISLTNGTFAEIGTTPFEQKSFDVNGRAAGTYGYRVEAVYADNIRSKPSNVEVTRVPGPGASPGTGAGTGTGGKGQGTGTPRSACASLSPRARATGIGPIRLGRKRSTNRRALGSARRRGTRSLDRYCVAGGGGLRVGYLTSRALRRITSAFAPRRLRGRAVLALSSSKRTSIRRLRPGASRRSLRRRLGRRRGIKVGRNVWYLARGSKATHVFKVSRGRVREVGLADRRLTRGRKRAKRFLTSFR